MTYVALGVATYLFLSAGFLTLFISAAAADRVWEGGQAVPHVRHPHLRMGTRGLKVGLRARPKA